MSKLILLSVLIVTVALPMRFARDDNARRGLRKTIIVMSMFLLLWFMFLIFVFSTAVASDGTTDG